MFVILIFLLMPSIFHVTTSLALNKINNSSLLIINTNNSKQQDFTPSSLSSAVDTTQTILQDFDSKLLINKNKNLKTPAPTSNRYRRNVIDLMENSAYDPNYNVVVDDERNFLPQITERLNNNGISMTDWENALLYRNRRGLIGGAPLSEEFSGMQIWNSVNLSGRRERPFYVDEPPYILVRREAEYPDLIGVQNEPFIPPRGRKSGAITKKSNLNNLFNTQNSDLFMPNRGKKIDPTEQYKRAKYNDLLLGDDLFFPNRGKKFFDARSKLSAPTSSMAQLLGTDDFFYPNRGKKSHVGNILKPNDFFYPNRGKKSRAAYTGGDLDDLDLFVPNRGKRNLLINKREILLNDKKSGNKITALRTTTATPTNNINNNSKSDNNNNNNNNDNRGDRYKRDLLDNLSKEKDTFYSARGRRNSNKNNNSINNNGERNNDNNNNNNNNNNNLNEKFMEENNKNFLDDKFYTSNEILKKSAKKNFNNDYGIVDDSRVKSFYFIKQIPTMYGMAGGDEKPMTRHNQQIMTQPQQQQQEPIIKLINTDTNIDGGLDTMDPRNDNNRYILPRFFDCMDNGA